MIKNIKILLFLLLTLLSFNFSNPLNAQKLENGQILSKNNTFVDCKIIIKNKPKYRAYQYIETYDSIYGIKKITPENIIGYDVNDESFERLSFNHSEKKTTIKIFAKVISKGKVRLLYSPIIGDVRADFYFFKKQNEVSYHVFRKGQIVDLGEVFYKNYAFNEEHVFLNFFSYYFSDCPLISRSLKTGMYNIGDLEMLVMDYNNCNN